MSAEILGEAGFLYVFDIGFPASLLHASYSVIYSPQCTVYKVHRAQFVLYSIQWAVNSSPCTVNALYSSIDCFVWPQGRINNRIILRTYPPCTLTTLLIYSIILNRIFKEIPDSLYQASFATTRSVPSPFLPWHLPERQSQGLGATSLGSLMISLKRQEQTCLELE